MSKMVGKMHVCVKCKMCVCVHANVQAEGKKVSNPREMMMIS